MVKESKKVWSVEVFYSRDTFQTLQEKLKSSPMPLDLKGSQKNHQNLKMKEYSFEYKLEEEGLTIKCTRDAYDCKNFILRGIQPIRVISRKL